MGVGRGRPPLPKEEQRLVRNIWYSDAETRARLEAYAERRGLSLSTATDQMVDAALSADDTPVARRRAQPDTVGP